MWTKSHQEHEIEWLKRALMASENKLNDAIFRLDKQNLINEDLNDKLGEFIENSNETNGRLNNRCDNLHVLFQTLLDRVNKIEKTGSFERIKQIVKDLESTKNCQNKFQMMIYYKTSPEEKCTGFLFELEKHLNSRLNDSSYAITKVFIKELTD